MVNLGQTVICSFRTITGSTEGNCVKLSRKVFVDNTAGRPHAVESSLSSVTKARVGAIILSDVSTRRTDQVKV